MSKMLRKKLIPAEFVVASSLLLAPGFTLTGFGQNSPQTSQPPASQPAATPPQATPLPPLQLRQTLRLPPHPQLPPLRRRLTRKCQESSREASTT